MVLCLAPDDPRADDVHELLERHLSFARMATPPAHVFALDAEGRLDQTVTYFSARRDGVLLGVGALKELDPSHGELKSMHTVEAARGQGVGRAMVEHLLSVGYTRVDVVEMPGQVTLRGGILDVYSPEMDRPVRVDFFGDEIESIRRFDPDTQRFATLFDAPAT